MTISIQPRVIWQGPTSWFDVAHSSSLGDSRSYVGPVPSRVLSPTLTAAVGARVQDVVEQACEMVGQAIVKNPQMCSRCARTLMRSALVSPVDSALVMTGKNPGDRERYAIAWRAMGPQVQAVQAAMAQLRAEAAAGVVRVRETAGRTQDAVDPTLTVKNSPWAPLYEQGGWPLKAGQWTDYQMCACGDPTVANTQAATLVSGASHHAGAAPACGCKHDGSP